MIASTKIINTEIFAFMRVLVLKKKTIETVKK